MPSPARFRAQWNWRILRRTMRWNPNQYGKFAGPRLQPGLDLLSRLPELPARSVVDLGCGKGELTALLKERYPEADVVGMDSSAQMLDAARARFPELVWERCAIEDFAPKEPLDVLFSNAALHWVADHDALVPRLFALLRRGGVFAVQMPRNFGAPSHRLMREVASQPPFAGRVSLAEEPVLPLDRYYDLLAPRAASVDLWETEYLHVLEGEDPVLEWVRGTALLPVQQALEADAFAAFVDAYRQRLRQAYPRREDGRTLFPFRRLFMVATAA